MRLRIRGSRTWRFVLAPACEFPRPDYEARGRKGSVASTEAFHSRATYKKDLAEVSAYLAKNPMASIRDVAMCCNMSDGQAQRLRAAARREDRPQEVIT